MRERCSLELVGFRGFAIWGLVGSGFRDLGLGGLQGSGVRGLGFQGLEGLGFLAWQLHDVEDLVCSKVGCCRDPLSRYPNPSQGNQVFCSGTSRQCGVAVNRRGGSS